MLVRQRRELGCHCLLLLGNRHPFLPPLCLRLKMSTFRGSSPPVLMSPPLTFNRPYFIKGTAIGCALSGVMVPIGLILHLLYTAENERKERESGSNTHQGPLDVSAAGDKHTNFRLLT